MRKTKNPRPIFNYDNVGDYTFLIIDRYKFKRCCFKALSIIKKILVSVIWFLFIKCNIFIQLPKFLKGV
jgi:hypothetical protein